jgi:hypothetical protein
VRYEQPRPAGREHNYLRAGFQQLLGQYGHRIGDVLAVVEDEHRLPIAQPGQYRLAGRTVVLLPQAERRSQSRGHHRAVGDRHQVDVPDAASELVGLLGSHRQSQPCLADAARADGGDQPVPAQRGYERCPLRGPADERSQRRRGQRRAGLPVGKLSAGSDLRRKTGQGAAVGHTELAKQRRDVTFDRPH